MKNIFFASLSFIALNAQAATPQLLAQAVTTGGLMGPNPKLCLGHEVSLYAHGDVIVSKCGKEAELVLTLGQKPTAAIAVLAAKADATGGQLLPVTPGQLQCHDAQSTLISLQTPNGLETIGGVQDCVKVELQFNDRDVHPESIALRKLDAVFRAAELNR